MFSSKLSTAPGENESPVAASVHNQPDSIRLFRLAMSAVGPVSITVTRTSFSLAWDGRSNPKAVGKRRLHHCGRAEFQGLSAFKKRADPKSGPLLYVTNMQQGGKLPLLVHNYVTRS